MQQTDNSVLLRQYAVNHSDEAFAVLVTRHIDLVYSVALRYVGDPHQAEEVAQAVFITLAKKAAHLRHAKALSSWLFQTTRLTASNFVRGETRRHRREQEAHMQSVLNESRSDDWRSIAPWLDDAVAGLSEKERLVIVLRFYEGRSLREVGSALGASEDAAQKRISRAVERLREYLAKHGVTIGTSGLVVAISANAVQAAPVGLAITISTAAALAATAVSTSTVIAATKTIAMTTLQKTLITASIAVVSGTGIYGAYENSKLHDRVQALRQQQAPPTEQIQQLRHERDEATRQLAALRDGKESLNGNNTELLKLRGEVGVLRRQNDELAKLLEDDAKLHQNSKADTQTSSQITELVRAKDLYIRTWLQAFFAYAKEHQGQCPADFQQAASFLSGSFREISQTADQFEILYHGPLNAIQGQDIIVLRERSLWQHIGGKWGRFYGLADGRAQYCSSSDKTANGSFDSYETERIISSPSQ